jgi:hypothetical protein
MVMGRPKKWIFDKAQAARVETLAGLGLRSEEISAVEKIPLASLKRLYQDVMSEGRAKALAKVSQSLYQMAVSGKNPASTFFYLKTQGRWKAVHTIEHSGPDGEAIQVENVNRTTTFRETKKEDDK